MTLYRIKTDQGEFFRFEDDETDDLLGGSGRPDIGKTEEQLEILLEQGTEEEVIVEDVSDMHEIQELGEFMSNLRRYDIQPGDFQTDGSSVEEKPLFVLKDGDNGQRTANSVRELLDQILDIGRRGITIYRYKGLAEMSSDQLRETTMDPNERILLQIKLEDVIEADRIFTVLMGNNVELRRAFIEKYGMQGKVDMYGA